MSPAQSSPGVNDGDRDRLVAAISSVSISSGDTGGERTRPSSVSTSQGGALPPSTKPLTAKEQAAAEEAKEKLERMVKVRAVVSFCALVLLFDVVSAGLGDCCSGWRYGTVVAVHLSQDIGTPHSTSVYS